MKSILIFLGFVLSVSLLSCESTSQDEAITNHEDTAVLVEDPNNDLNAAPINDTTVKDTVPVKDVE